MDFVNFITKCYEGLEIEINLYGFTFSFIDIIMWSLLVSLILWVVKIVLNVSEVL